MAQFDASAHTCIVVVVDDGFADSILDTGVKDDVRALQAGQGCYFDTKVRLDGKPVWKQVPDAVSSSNDPMIWWFSPDAGFGGWYCSSDVWATEKEQLLLKPLVSYWSRGTDHDQNMPTPGQIHFPFLAKKVNESITVVTLFDKYLDLIADYELETSAMSEQVQCLQMRIADMDNAVAEQKSTADGPKAGAQKPPGQHGGWMPRCAQLIAAIRAKNWQQVQKLADKFYNFSNMSEMVDRMRV